MNIESEEVNKVVQLLCDKGNVVVDVSEGWSKVKQVVHMKLPIDEGTRTQIKSSFSKLRYWKDNGSPHNPPSEGFICDSSKVGITFPME